MSISPPTRHQTDFNCCGTCKSIWRVCKCKSEARTESVESLLGNADLFPDADRRHTCVFLYHSYHRWSLKHGQGADEFTLSVLPLWEGWYAAWLKPEMSFPEDVPWSEFPVLKCTVRYVNGTYLDGYIDSDGRLLLSFPGVRPPYGKDYDEDRSLVRMAVGVSQGLTIEEIRLASRGLVYGGSTPPNSWRRASHVLREEEDMCVVRILAEKDGMRGEDVRIEKERVRQFVPHMIDEAKWRGRRRFKRQLGKELQRFLHALFERARLNDEAVRFALRRGWLEGLPSPGTLIKEVAQEMAALSGGGGNNAGPADVLAEATEDQTTTET